MHTTRELRRWAARTSLIGPGTVEEVLERHYGESLAALPLRAAERCPRRPRQRRRLSRAWCWLRPAPELEVTLVEPRERKWAFLAAAARRAGLDCRCLDARVGALLPTGFPHGLAVITSRALRLATTTLEVLATRLAPGGRILLWQGAEDPDLPGNLRQVGAAALPNSRERRLVILGRDEDQRMSTVLAIANQKGGVGKTTTAINLGAALAALERRVLLVDCDPQGNATRGLGQTATEPNLYHVLSGDAPLDAAIRPSGFPISTCCRPTAIWSAWRSNSPALEHWEQVLRRALEPALGQYHTILLDCPPSLGHLTVNALVAASAVLVPLQCEYFALEGISELMATVERVRGGLNRTLDISGIVLTMYDERTNLAQDVAAEVRRHFADKVFRTVVPRNVRLAEAPSHGLPVLLYDIKCRGAEAYLDLAREMLGEAA